MRLFYKDDNKFLKFTLSLQRNPILRFFLSGNVLALSGHEHSKKMDRL